MDSEQQRDVTEEEANRLHLAHEGLAELADLTDGDPLSAEWHQARAKEAIDADELDLAHAHLYLAAELQNALVRKARAHLERRKLIGAFRNLSPAAEARLWAMIEQADGQEPTMPNAGHWHATSEPTHLDPHPGVHAPTPSSMELDEQAPDDAEPAMAGGRGLSCSTCGVRAMYFASGPVQPGWWHLDADGRPIGAVDGHGVRLT